MHGQAEAPNHILGVSHRNHEDYRMLHVDLSMV